MITEASVTERAAYLIFVTAVGLGLGLFTIVLVAVVLALVRQHRRTGGR